MYSGTGKPDVCDIFVFQIMTAAGWCVKVGGPSRLVYTVIQFACSIEVQPQSRWGRDPAAGFRTAVLMCRWWVSMGSPNRDCKCGCKLFSFINKDCSNVRNVSCNSRSMLCFSCSIPYGRSSQIGEVQMGKIGGGNAHRFGAEDADRGGKNLFKITVRVKLFLLKFKSLEHQWILCSEWVPSEWEAPTPSINVLWSTKLCVCKKIH